MPKKLRRIRRVTKKRPVSILEPGVFRHAIVGLDVSLTETGLVIITATPDPHEVLYTDIVTTDPKARDLSRCLGAADVIIRTIQKGCFLYDKVSVFIEASGSSRFAGKLITRMELVGMVKYKLFRIGCNLYTVTPASLKQEITGKGNATKNKMLTKVNRLTGNEYTNDNVADAHALSIYGWRMLIGGKRLDHDYLSNANDLARFQSEQYL